MISLVGRMHAGLIFARRARVLAEKIADLLPAGASVLDVGCGDGTISSLVQAGRPDVTISGIDVMVRPSPKIPVTAFDGETLPFADHSFDTVVFIDVLHHTNEPGRLVHEAARVARKCVVIKDHLCENLIDRALLAMMDWVGNAPHGVSLPYNYLSQREWDTLYAGARLHVMQATRDLRLYAWPLNLVFGRGLHVISVLDRATPDASGRLAS